MTGIEDRIGSTTAGTEVRTARFTRGKAILAALGLALAILAALALSDKASAHGTGYIGSHAHGQLYCGNYGRINLYGDGGFYRLRASAHDTMAGYKEVDVVTHRAHLYRWNGQSWAYQASTGWYDTSVSGYMSTSLGFPGPFDSPFVVNRGSYKVSTEIRWYDTAAGGYLGSSPNAWAQGMCTYG